MPLNNLHEKICLNSDSSCEKPVRAFRPIISKAYKQVSFSTLLNREISMKRSY